MSAGTWHTDKGRSEEVYDGNDNYVCEVWPDIAAQIVAEHNLHAALVAALRDAIEAMTQDVSVSQACDT